MPEGAARPNCLPSAEDFVGGTGVGLFEILIADDMPPGMLQAWDPVKQEATWTVPQEYPWNAGALATAGNLAFQRRYDGLFVAYDATTGGAEPRGVRRAILR